MSDEPDPDTSYTPQDLRLIKARSTSAEDILNEAAIASAAAVLQSLGAHNANLPARENLYRAHKTQFVEDLNVAAGFEDQNAYFPLHHLGYRAATDEELHNMIVWVRAAHEICETSTWARPPLFSQLMPVLDAWSSRESFAMYTDLEIGLPDEYSSVTKLTQRGVDRAAWGSSFSFGKNYTDLRGRLSKKGIAAANKAFRAWGNANPEELQAGSYATLYDRFLADHIGPPRFTPANDTPQLLVDALLLASANALAVAKTSRQEHTTVERMLKSSTRLDEEAVQTQVALLVLRQEVNAKIALYACDCAVMCRSIAALIIAHFSLPMPEGKSLRHYTRAEADVLLLQLTATYGAPPKYIS